SWSSSACCITCRAARSRGCRAIGSLRVTPGAAWRAASQFVWVRRKPASTMANPASWVRLGISPRARKPISSVKPGTSEGNTAAGAEQHHRAGEEIDRAGAGENALYDEL